jgi:hypothetical protein
VLELFEGKGCWEQAFAEFSSKPVFYLQMRQDFTVVGQFFAYFFADQKVWRGEL